jgi:hypothetical protein
MHDKITRMGGVGVERPDPAEFRMSFKQNELMLQLAWKSRTRSLSAGALAPGLYTGPSDRKKATRQEMFLHETRSEENLIPDVRRQALEIFQQEGIDWHHGPVGKPSNYLMDSMVSCVNCLMPFATDGVALATLLRPLVPDAVEAEPIEDGRVMSFEWMGVDNPLREPSPKRKRGSHGTSADTFCKLRRADGGRTGLLLEWKYTESYLDEEQKFGSHYLPLLEAADGPIDLTRCGGARALFLDPLYQLARLQLLAQATERAQALGCDRVIVAVIVPDGNLDYRRHIPGADLRQRYAGLSLEKTWSTLLRLPDRFVLTSLDELLSAFRDDAFPGIAPALREIRARYSRRGPRES